MYLYSLSGSFDFVKKMERIREFRLHGFRYFFMKVKLKTGMVW
jgi:hypothetical protein